MDARAKKDFRPVHDLSMLVLGSPLIFAAFLLHGWVLQVLWNWFLLGLGAPRLTYIAAIGIVTIFAFLCSHGGRYDPRSRSKRFAAQMEGLFVYPFFYLFLGFVFHHFS